MVLGSTIVCLIGLSGLLVVCFSEVAIASGNFLDTQETFFSDKGPKGLRRQMSPQRVLGHRLLHMKRISCKAVYSSMSVLLSGVETQSEGRIGDRFTF